MEQLTLCSILFRHWHISKDREGSQTPYTLTQLMTLSNPSSLIPLPSSQHSCTAGEREHEQDWSYTGVAERHLPSRHPAHWACCRMPEKSEKRSKRETTSLGNKAPLKQTPGKQPLRIPSAAKHRRRKNSSYPKRGENAQTDTSAALESWLPRGVCFRVISLYLRWL